MSEVHVAVEQGALQQVYDERNRLVALAVVLACEAGYRVGLIDDADEPDWPVLAIELPTGQVAWPVPQDVANLLSEVEEVEVTRFVCDGHDGAAQAQRIERFIQAETWPDGADSGEAADDDA
jgi:hypothetical protein